MEKLIIRINCTIGILICQSVLNLSIYGTFDVPALFLHGRILEYKRKLCVLLHKKSADKKAGGICKYLFLPPGLPVIPRLREIFRTLSQLRQPMKPHPNEPDHLSPKMCPQKCSQSFCIRLLQRPQFSG